MITVARFNKPEEGHLLRMRLEAAGIGAYVQDENIIQVEILTAIAMGGVRVQIAEKDLSAAHELLAQDHGVADYQPTFTCPKCGSSHIARERFSRRIAYLSLLLLAIPLLWIRPRLRCDECLHTWKQPHAKEKKPAD